MDMEINFPNLGIYLDHVQWRAERKRYPPLT